VTLYLSLLCSEYTKILSSRYIEIFNTILLTALLCRRTWEIFKHNGGCLKKNTSGPIKYKQRTKFQGFQPDGLYVKVEEEISIDPVVTLWCQPGPVNHSIATEAHSQTVLGKEHEVCDCTGWVTQTCQGGSLGI
jgi:hypothetical protein